VFSDRRAMSPQRHAGPAGPPGLLGERGPTTPPCSVNAFGRLSGGGDTALVQQPATTAADPIPPHPGLFRPCPRPKKTRRAPIATVRPTTWRGPRKHVIRRRTGLTTMFFFRLVMGPRGTWSAAGVAPNAAKSACCGAKSLVLGARKNCPLPAEKCRRQPPAPSSAPSRRKSPGLVLSTAGRASQGPREFLPFAVERFAPRRDRPG